MILAINATSGGKVSIKTQSPFTGNVSETVLNMSHQEFTHRLSKWQDGEMLQVAFSNLDAPHRELVKSGVTPQEWEDMFAMAEEEEYDDDPV